MSCETLAALGRVAVSFTLLETAANTLARAIAGNAPPRWKDDIPLGGKLRNLRKLAKLVTDATLAAELAPWLDEADKLCRERADAVKTFMAYGAGEDLADAIVRVGVTDRKGNPSIVEPAALNVLAQRLRDTAIDGIRLGPPITGARLGVR
jgi:hypothetical protein